MEPLPYNVYASKCPTREALDRIADKWTSLIVGLLADGPRRFGELRRSIEGISQKMLTQTLRSLEGDGLILRRVCTTSPMTVEYSLTPLGRTGARQQSEGRAPREESRACITVCRAVIYET
jgi:DNA-binding HxlR family transcriptional regulator